MATLDEVAVLAERVHRDLDAVHDFFDHTEIVWSSFAAWVGAGHSLTFRARGTGTTITPNELLALSSRYRHEYLAVFTFQRFVTVFEGFMFDLLRILLVQYPARLSNKTIDVGTVLAAPDREAVVLAVIDKELNEVKYKKLREWFAYLDGLIHLGCPTAEEIETLAEIKARRDVLEHNAGVANATYRTKAGPRAHYSVGERVEIPDDYFLASWGLIKKVVQDVSAAVVARLTPSPPPGP